MCVTRGYLHPTVQQSVESSSQGIRQSRQTKLTVKITVKCKREINMKFFSTIPQQFTSGLIAALIVLLSLGSLALGQAQLVGTVDRNANLRAGPGTTYAIVGRAAQGQSVTIVDTNTTGDWYRLADEQWIAAFLVNVVNAAPAPVTTRVLLPSNQPAIGATPLAETSTATASRAANLRGGPGTSYAVVGTVSTGQALTLSGHNANGSWYQLADGAWIAAFLVNDVSSAFSPAPSSVPAIATPVPVRIQTTPVPTAPPVRNGNDFVLVQKRLWDPYENGGSLDGPSVHCGYSRRLVVNVLDANGNRLNGVAVQVQYGAREIEVTGAQGRGDGVAEFVLGGGQDVKIIRDTDGSAAASDLATGLSTNPQAIPFDLLISGRYCQDAATCRNFAETNSCNGHFSWTVTFQRAGN